MGFRGAFKNGKARIGIGHIRRADAPRLVFDRIPEDKDLWLLHGAGVLRGMAGGGMALPPHGARRRRSRQPPAVADGGRRSRREGGVRDRALEL